MTVRRRDHDRAPTSSGTNQNSHTDTSNVVARLLQHHIVGVEAVLGPASTQLVHDRAVRDRHALRPPVEPEVKITYAGCCRPQRRDPLRVA